MDQNIPVWSYYEKGFIDPLYAPYQKVKVPVHNNKPVSNSAITRAAFNDRPQGPMCYVDVERGNVQNDVSPSLDAVYPSLERRNWGLNFQRMFSYDPCPPGYKKEGLNWCVHDNVDFEPIFYTDAQYQKKGKFYPQTMSNVSQRWKSDYSDTTLPFIKNTTWVRNSGGRPNVQTQNYGRMPLPPMLV